MTPAADIVAALLSVTGGKAGLHEPEIAGNEWAYVKDCLDTNWVSSVGAYVDRFEAMLAAFTGAGHAVATVNGTAALHVCLMLAGVKAGDEVIVPALTFVATANAVAYCGAVPHFVDSSETTLGLDPVKLEVRLRDSARAEGGRLVNRETGRPIAAVVVMHAFGHPVDLDPVAEVCRRHGLPLIEDAAESLGSTYKGRHCGTTGVLAALSFNGNKIVTTGGGGAVLTSDPDLARAAKHLTTTAKLPHRWEFIHDRIGYNYRLPNLNAAMGCAQLERLPGFVERKRALAERYREAVAPLSGLRFVSEPPHCRSNYWLNGLLLDPGNAEWRDEVLDALNGAGVMSRPAWTPMHRLPAFSECPRGDLSSAEGIVRRLINIPSSPGLAA